MNRLSCILHCVQNSIDREYKVRNSMRTIAYSLSQFNEPRLFFSVLNNIELERPSVSDGDTFVGPRCTVSWLAYKCTV